MIFLDKFKIYHYKFRVESCQLLVRWADVIIVIIDSILLGNFLDLKLRLIGLSVCLAIQNIAT